MRLAAVGVYRAKPRDGPRAGSDACAGCSGARSDARPGPRAWRGRARRHAGAAATVLLLVSCAMPLTDGPGDSPPAHLERTPDAIPRIEPIRAAGPNRPYEVAGRRHVPLTADVAFAETGAASWYGRKFHGRPTSSGEPYDMYAMTAAHKTLPIPSYARVRNPANGREVVVRINDRGPFVDGRVIDLSYTAALKLGLLAGVASVEVRRLTFADIRALQLLGLAPAEP
jgi:rare lipoprotein A